MNYDEARERREYLKNQEAAGNVADSLDVRKGLIERMHAGELTLAQVQAELAKIKRNAHKAGKLTRSQAFNGVRAPAPEYKCCGCNYPVAGPDMFCGECSCEDDGYCD